MSVSQSNPPASNTIDVLHVVHWPNSGITSFLKSFLAQREDSGFRYHFLSFLRDDSELRDFENVCHSVRCLDFDRNKLTALRTYRQIIRNICPDIIHTHSFQPGIWGRLFALGTGAKVISTIHSPYPYYEARCTSDRFKTAAEIFSTNLLNSRTICVSRAVQQHLIKNTRIKSRNLEVVWNGISPLPIGLETTDLTDRRAELGSDPSAKIIITVGRLSEEKGLDDLLTAFSRVLQDRQNVVLVIIGTGKREGMLKRMACDLGIDKGVRFLGFRKHVFPYLAVSDLYVSASLYEGLPISILEAMAAGIPVVATNVGGVPEVITDGVNGMLVEPGNPESLAQSMLGLLEDSALCKAFAKNGQRRLRADFDICNTVKVYQKLYLDLVNAN